MPWSLGSVVNNYNQPIAIEVFSPAGSTVNYATTPISGGNINVIVPLRGTLAFVNIGRVPGSVPPFGIDAFYLDQTWSFRYAQTTTINVTIGANGTPTLQQV